MRILANERGHDVAWVKEDLPGAEDLIVLEQARTELRLLVTFDSDFGELAFRARLPTPCGIPFFRLGGSKPEIDNARALTAIESRDDWTGHFAVVEDDRIRVRPLPPPR